MPLTPPSLATSPSQALGLNQILENKRREAEQSRLAQIQAAQTSAQGLTNAANFQSQGITAAGQANAAGTLSVADAVNNFFTRMDTEKQRQVAAATEQRKFDFENKKFQTETLQKQAQLERDYAKLTADEKKAELLRLQTEAREERLTEAMRNQNKIARDTLTESMRHNKASEGISRDKKSEDDKAGSPVSDFTDMLNRISGEKDLRRLNAVKAGVVGDKRWGKKQSQLILQAIENQIRKIGTDSGRVF